MGLPKRSLPDLPLTHTWIVWKFAAAVIGVGVLVFGLFWLDGSNDKVQFYGYIQKYAPRDERPWLDDHRELALTDGRAFCDWLEQFPEVPEVVPSGDADIGRFRSRYIETTAASTEMAISSAGRITVLAAAGAYFCDSTVDSRTSFSVPEEDL